ncbi:MAG TPA: OmpA family protein [Candidatus Kapabacteria bacterium]|nr:OmpA family protein [Candidatus Kapabacteria bacterium]
MHKSNIRRSSLVILFISLSLILLSCTSTRKTGFDLQKEIYEQEQTNKLSDEPEPIYMSDVKPIDSIDVDKVIFDIYRVEPNDYPKEVRLFARVYDSLGNFVTNLADPYLKNPNSKFFTSVKEELGKNYNIRKASIDNFKVREYGAEDSIAYNLVLTTDYSGSMNSIMDAIFVGTELFVKMKFPYDKIALTSFNKDYDIKAPLSKDTNEILKYYRSNRNTNKGLFSAVYDAVWKSFDVLNVAPDEEYKVVVIFTDGDDNYSKFNLDSLIRRANNEKVNVFCVAFGYSEDINLKNLAKYTGGKYYKAHTKEQLIKIFKDIYLSLRFHYKISYKPPTYWGYHKVFAGLNLPKRADSLIAEGEYDTSGWLALSDTVIRPIQFDFDSTSVKPESYPIIDELVDLMYTWPKLRFDIHGHTDNVGTQEYNQILSEKRAKAVYDLLISKGIDEKRLRYRGFGFSRPIAQNDTEQGKAKNRRTEFIIIAK